MAENFSLEQFPIECRKTKTKVITLANHERYTQSKLAVNPRSGRKAGKTRENECEQVVIGFEFSFNWVKKWRDFWSQLCSIVRSSNATNQLLNSTLK